MSEESPSTPKAAPPPTPPGPAPALPSWALLLILLAFLVLLGVGVGSLLTKLRTRPTGGTAEATVEKVYTFESPLPLPQEPLLQEEGEPLDATFPTAITVRGTTFPVVATPTRGGKWPVPEEGEEAVWLYGTIINYVIGLPYSETTAELLGSLGSGETLTLTLNNGRQLLFGAPQSRRIPADETAPLAQDHPGLTLALLLERESDQRLIVQARYLPEATTTAGEQAIGDLKVAFLSMETRDEKADELGGRPILVHYRVHNGGEASLDPAYFDLRLQDGEGRIFLLNPQVTAMITTANPTLIQPGETVTLTAGFLVPRETPPPLTWLFRPDPARSTEVRFDLPYHPLPPEPARPRVELTSAFVDGPRNLIVINGIVHNDGGSPLTVTLDDLQLTSSKGESALHSASPLLPWTIPGGDEQRFELQFARPEGVSSVLLDLLGFTFQLNGLP